LGAIYVREGANCQKLTTAEEIRSFFQTSNRIYFDAIPCPRFDLNKDLDENSVKHFRYESNITGSVSTNQILDNLRVFDESGAAKNGSTVLWERAGAIIPAGSHSLCPFQRKDQGAYHR
jgi:ATP-dependent DNA helicase RecG